MSSPQPHPCSHRPCLPAPVIARSQLQWRLGWRARVRLLRNFERRIGFARGRKSENKGRALWSFQQPTKFVLLLWSQNPAQVNGVQSTGQTTASFLNHSG
jgi:hypothetical protein